MSSLDAIATETACTATAIAEPAILAVSAEKKDSIDNTAPAATPKDDAITGVAAAATAATEEETPLSKNQQKKKRKWERAMEVKKRRKEQEKGVKAAKAKAEGRDLEQERLEQAERAKDGAGRRRRQEGWDRHKAPKIKTSFQVAIDCSFESLMTAKEITSLSNQIRYCYAYNRRNPHPCALSVTSLAGDTLKNLQNVSGFDGWGARAFSFSDKPVKEVFADRIQDVVYLTSDSENVIDDLDDSKIYIIGGIVDRNRLPEVAIRRAEEWGLQTAKLPLASYLAKMKTTKVLTCNHVFEILLKYRVFGKDWEKALLEVLPSRKECEAGSHIDNKDDDDENGDNPKDAVKPDPKDIPNDTTDKKGDDGDVKTDEA